MKLLDSDHFLKPLDLTEFLNGIIKHQLKISTMIWGPPGIGKSSIVMQVAKSHNLECIDLRLSQLAPTDLRGLPVADDGVARWYPPEFLPVEGAGILFLDELNLAPPTMQGMAQQLILDRRVGSYTVPDGWFIWAAGNRKEDLAVVYDMPAPLANRFLHLEVKEDFDSFKRYALTRNVNEKIIAFLAFRPALLYKLEPQQMAWPSPRSWVMASELLKAGLGVEAAVGKSAALEFNNFVALYASVPDLERIVQGDGDDLPFPEEPSLRYATTIGLTSRAKDAEAAYNAFRWLIEVATEEWCQLYAIDLFRLMRVRGEMKKLRELIKGDILLQQFLIKYQQLLDQ